MTKSFTNADRRFFYECHLCSISAQTLESFHCKGLEWSKRYLEKGREMSDRRRYGGGGGGHRQGRGGGRGDSREISLREGRDHVENNVTKKFSIGNTVISADAEHPTIIQYERGQLGRQVEVRVNYMLIQCDKKEAMHYELDFEEYAEDAEEFRGIVKKIARSQNWPKNWAHDGRKMLYTCGDFPLPKSSEETEFKVNLMFRGKDKEFTVKFKNVNTIKLDQIDRYCRKEVDAVPRDALQVLDVALRHGIAMNESNLLIRNNVFDLNCQGNDISMGAECWQGYHQSLRPCQGGLFLNVDTAVSPFHKGISVDRYIEDIIGRDFHEATRKGLRRDCRRIAACLKGVKIKTRRGNQVQKIKGFTLCPQDAMFFHKKSEKDMSVLDYYRQMGDDVRYPRLDCLDCSKGKRKIYVPPEFATIIPGQVVKVIQRAHTEKMIKVAAQRPDDRARYVESLVDSRRGAASVSNNESAKAFGISMDRPSLARVDARILPQPFLKYRQPECMDVGTQGQWNLLNAQFYHAGEIRSWALVSFCESNSVQIQGEKGIEAFLGELMGCLTANGVNLPQSRTPIPIHYSHRSPGEDLREAKRMAEEEYGRAPDIILALLPGRVTQIYKAVKMESDTRMGVPTQCFLADKASIGQRARPPRGRNQYCNNLAMKINAKIRGVNCCLVDVPGCRLPLLEGNQGKPFMIFGADVSHPQGMGSSSVAAIVGSLDQYAFQYACRIAVQQGHQEEISDFKVHFKELLKEFYKRTNQKKPEAIIYYRDGVSDGQFEKVLQYEYAQMREGCKEMGDARADYCPPITFVTVQKRHHTRMFPQGDAHRSGNVMPGTIVDTKISSPTGFDFYLCSQAGLQGTSRPAHYHVLVDENNYGSDALQIMTYWLTFIYCRCTKSVAIPAPVYYAHLAAFRARMLLEPDMSADDVSVASSGGEPMAFPGIPTSLKSVMFYV
ncbi:hypothetical protein BSKO_01020 [Bryopsis sp. KO-2023]|nr:hypothetical protein BSKO_01020 [Bryopsis sp. KO-2023]